MERDIYFLNLKYRKVNYLRQYNFTIKFQYLKRINYLRINRLYLSLMLNHQLNIFGLKQLLIQFIIII